MLTSKQRAYLRSMASTYDTIMQVGKGGVTPNIVKTISDALEARELIKLRVLTETSPLTPREAAEELAAKTGSEVVQVIGGSMIFYKENPELQAEKKAKEKPKKSGTGKGAKDFKKKYNAQAKKAEKAQKDQKKSRYSKTNSGRFYK